MSGQPKPRVALFAAPESSPSILFGLYDVLSTVGAVYPDMTVGQPGDELLELSIVAVQAEPFRCIGNVLVEPTAAIDDEEAYAGEPRALLVWRDRRELAPVGGGCQPGLRRMHSRGSLIASVCTGSLLVAAAGLLEWTIHNETPSGATQASGTEQFSGCLNGSRCGHFWTTYTFTYKVVDGVETHGRCHHPIVRGDEGFAGVRGVIQMHDLPNGCAVYTGQLSF